MSDTCEALVLRHWQEANRAAWDGFAALLSPDLVYEVPQTRERIRGSIGYVDLFRTWPEPYEPPVRVSQYIERYAPAPSRTS